MVILLPLLICVAGLLIYVLAANPKVVEIGRLMFLAGLLACLFGSPGLTSNMRLGG